MFVLTELHENLTDYMFQSTLEERKWREIIQVCVEMKARVMSSVVYIRLQEYPGIPCTLVLF